MATLNVIDLGRCSYARAVDLQKRLVAGVQAAPGEEAHIVLVEHDPPVITVGRSSRGDGNVLASADALKAEGIEVVECSRGGDVTYHGPGQLVGYPIIRLDLHGRDIHRYLRDLEEVLIRVLGVFGITGRRVRGQTGVWVGEEKVAAIGIAVTRWVTYHGFALNVATNLSHFDFIIPCGITDKTVTSVERLLGRPVGLDEVKPRVIRCFADVFGFQLDDAAGADKDEPGDCRP
ncbi:MAG: lipoyl(octanoyl) transferase LipB [Planctomycetia bacterium]|nr:lipoyl(octanoyl) transferase LipB [Planctomycetia bacterium]